tara:strand:- start:228 stop:500 length:273 start_codon:yes stop_codon:yes gene_type:complete
MVSITVSVPESTREIMKKFPEVNWSGLVRGTIEEKAKRLLWKQKMLAQLNSKEEQDFIEWGVDLGRKAKNDSFKRVLSNLSKKEKEKFDL